MKIFTLHLIFIKDSLSKLSSSYIDNYLEINYSQEIIALLLKIEVNQILKALINYFNCLMLNRFLESIVKKFQLMKVLLTKYLF